jgi:hypothetical protein
MWFTAKPDFKDVGQIYTVITLCAGRIIRLVAGYRGVVL